MKAISKLLFALLLVAGTTLPLSGCGGSDTTVNEAPPVDAPMTETDKEMESEEYEKAMSEM